MSFAAYWKSGSIFLRNSLQEITMEELRLRGREICHASAGRMLRKG